MTNIEYRRPTQGTWVSKERTPSQPCYLGEIKARTVSLRKDIFNCLENVYKYWRDRKKRRQKEHQLCR